MFVHHVLSALVLVSLSAFAATYQDPLGRFAFEYDGKAWEIAEKSAEKTLVTLQKKEADEKYHARFSVVLDSAEKYRGNETERLAGYHSDSVQFLKNQQFQMLLDHATKLPRVTHPVYETHAANRHFGLTLKQVIFLSGTGAWLLTLSTRNAAFEKNLAEQEALFSSFQFFDVKG